MVYKLNLRPALKLDLKKHKTLRNLSLKVSDDGAFYA